MDSKTDNQTNKDKMIPDFSQSDRGKVPQHLTWKADDIYPDVAAWENDKNKMAEMIGQIKDLEKEWMDSAKNVYRLFCHITEIEKISDSTYIYAQLFSDTDMGNSKWQAMKGEIQIINVNFSGMLTFINPGILKMGREKIDRYIREEPRLDDYRMDFDMVLRLEKHILPSDQKKIVTESGLFSGSAGRASGILNDVDMPAPQLTLSTGERVRLNQATYLRLRESNIREDRVKAVRAHWRNRSRFKNTQAALLDGAVKSHLFHANVHHYDNCIESALFPNNISPKVYHNLLDTVKANLTPLHRYLKLKTKMLKLDRLTYDDLYASSVPSIERLFTIEEAQELIIQSMRPLGSDYTNLLEQGFSSRWTDVYPNKGKRSGAYSQGSVYGLHPFVLMNYNGSFNHVSTLAHEFGHALHSWLSNKNQPYPLAHYPIFLAEIASTFNENLLVHHMVETETDNVFKLFILDQYIDEFRGTLFRQTMFADFELAMHQWVESNQTLTPDWLDKKYLELTRLYLGHKEKAIHVNKYIESEWSVIPHFYYDFYVYQYSTGIAAATALAKMVLEGGETERKRYLDFLSSGYSQYPLDILKEAGVDLTTAHPIQMAIDHFNSIITKMEEIMEKI